MSNVSTVLFAIAWAAAQTTAFIAAHRLGRANAALDRVRALHAPKSHDPDQSYRQCDECYPDEWPCATIRAIDADRRTH